jgi:KDO2-lipid IV(A) lauroyltransferase
MVRKNLVNSFPDKSEKEITKIERDFYRNLCDYGVETLKLITISAQELRKRFNYIDISRAQYYKDQGQSIVVLASHQFNWEWLVATAKLEFPMDVDFVYQPQRSKLFNEFSLLGRTRFGSYPIKRAEVAREAIKRKNILRAIAIVADQYPGHKNDKRYFTTFLNQETAFFQGVNQLAIMTQSPVLFAEIKKVKRGYYAVSFPEIATPPYEKDSFEVIEQYVRVAEKRIQEEPSGWLWSHNRWKKRHLKQHS